MTTTAFRARNGQYASNPLPPYTGSVALGNEKALTSIDSINAKSLEERQRELFGISAPVNVSGAFDGQPRPFLTLADSLSDTARYYVSRVIRGRIAQEDTWIYELLPLTEKPTAELDAVIKTIEYNAAMPHTTPELGVSPEITRSKREMRIHGTRQGIQMSFVNGFLATPEGVKDYLASIAAINNATIRYFIFSGIYALLDAVVQKDSLNPLASLGFGNGQSKMRDVTQYQQLLWGCTRKYLGLSLALVRAKTIFEQRGRKPNAIIVSHGVNSAITLAGMVDPQGSFHAGGVLDHTTPTKYAASNPLAGQVFGLKIYESPLLDNEDPLPREDPTVRVRSYMSYAVYDSDGGDSPLMLDMDHDEMREISKAVLNRLIEAARAVDAPEEVYASKKYAIVRRCVKSSMGSSILVEGGPGLGGIYHGESDLQWGVDAQRKSTIGNFTFHCAVAVTAPDRVMVLHNTHPVEYLGGGGLTEDDLQAFPITDETYQKPPPMLILGRVPRCFSDKSIEVDGALAAFVDKMVALNMMDEATDDVIGSDTDFSDDPSVGSMPMAWRDNAYYRNGKGPDGNRVVEAYTPWGPHRDYNGVVADRFGRGTNPYMLGKDQGAHAYRV